jgi:hypothetical protein
MIRHCVTPHSARHLATRLGWTPRGRSPARRRLRRSPDHAVHGQRRMGRRRTTRRCRRPRPDLSHRRRRRPRHSGSGISRARRRRHPLRVPREGLSTGPLSRDREPSSRTARRGRTGSATRRSRTDGAPLPAASSPRCRQRADRRRADRRRADRRRAHVPRRRRSGHRRATVLREDFRASRRLARSQVSACHQATGNRRGSGSRRDSAPPASRVPAGPVVTVPLGWADPAPPWVRPA